MTRSPQYRIECSSGNKVTMVQYRVTRQAATELWSQLRRDRPAEYVYLRQIPELMPWVRPA